MKKIILLLIFQVCATSLIGQHCGKTNVSAELELKIKTDSIYKNDVRFRTEYYVKLTKSILPKYFGLKENIQQKLKPEDSAILENITTSYENNRSAYLSEFQETQFKVYQNTLAYSNLNTLLIFETLNAFPDSYALLLNKSALNSKAKEKDILVINQLYSKYKSILAENTDCITEMKNEISIAKSELNIVDVLQNTGNVSLDEKSKAELMDLLIWAKK